MVDTGEIWFKNGYKAGRADGYKEGKADAMARINRLRAEIERHRQFIERLTDGGTDYGEEWEDLLATGLIVEVKPTPEFIDEWGEGSEMWVLAWKTHGFEEVE